MTENILLHDTVFLSHLIFWLVSNLGETDRKSYIKSPQHTIPNIAVEGDEKEIPQEEKLVEETIAVDEEEKDDAEEEEG